MNEYKNENECSKLRIQDLVYHTSEQYLILCLRLCNLIINKKCQINNLIINNNNNNSRNRTTTLMFSNLNETECAKYAHRETYKLSLFVAGFLLCLAIMGLNARFSFMNLIKKWHNSNNFNNNNNINHNININSNKTHQTLIINLSLSDFLLGLAFMYPCSLNLLTIHSLETYNVHLYTLTCSIRNHYYMCLAGYSPMITSMLNSMFTLFLLAMDKYICIVKPYVYLKQQRRQKQNACVYVCVVVWCMAIFVSLLPLMGYGTEEYNNFSKKKNSTIMSSVETTCMFERIFTLDYILLFTCICGLCAFAILTIYVHIYFIARKHYKQIIVRQQQQQITSTTITTINNEGRDSSSLNIQITSTNSVKNINNNMKAMKTLLILLLGFYVCWLPLIVYFLSFATQKYNNLTIHILMFVACCNAIVDPIVYSFRNK